MYWVTQEREFQTTVPIENLEWKYVCETMGQHCQNGTGRENVKKKKVSSETLLGIPVA